MAGVYYWPDIPNSGDLLSIPLLNWWANVPGRWAPLEEADVVVIGSILEHIPSNWNGYVVGPGRLLEDSDLTLESAHVLAVRGPLSARGIRGDFALGDPGLLADEMVDVPTRDIELGLVPHWSDTELAHRYEFAPYNPVVISPFWDPLKFVETIGRCKKVVSSSLHGVIIADAFGIPRRTEAARRFKDNWHEGGFFKFRDYNSSVGVPFELGLTQQPARGAVENRKHEVYDAMSLLGELL